MSRIYTEHFSLLAEHTVRVDAAYRVLERARGRATNDLLQTGFSADRSSTKDVDRQISALQLRLTAARTKREVRKVREEIFFAQQKRWLTVRARTPDVPQAVTLDDVRKQLAPDELLLEFVWSEPRSYWLVISRQNARITSVAAEGHLAPMVDSFVSAVKRKQTAEMEGRKLYRALFAGVAELQAKPRLIIVPDGPLHLTPFDALVNAKDKGWFRTT